jgi:hypothetical protein
MLVTMYQTTLCHDPEYCSVGFSGRRIWYLTYVAIFEKLRNSYELNTWKLYWLMRHDQHVWIEDNRQGVFDLRVGIRG